MACHVATNPQLHCQSNIHRPAFSGRPSSLLGRKHGSNAKAVQLGSGAFLPSIFVRSRQASGMQKKWKSQSFVTRAAKGGEMAPEPESTGPDDSSGTSWTSIVAPFLFPAVGGALFGYDIGSTSGALISLKDPVLSGTDWYNLSPLASGAVVSGSLAGALGGSILAYAVADALGRRKELLAAAGLFFSGALTMVLSSSLATLITGRVLYGLGIGLAMHGAPLYISETVPAALRGRLVSLKEGFIVAGILLGYVVGSAFIGAEGGWRDMVGASIPLSLMMAAGMVWLPDSPRWLLLQGNKEGKLENAKQDALASLRRIRGSGASEASLAAEVEETATVLATSEQAGAGGAGGDKDLVSGFQELLQGPNKKGLIIGTGLVLFQQITGQPSVLYYASAIFQESGFANASDAAKVSVLLGCFKLLMTGFSIAYVDSFGRRPLLLIGVGGMVFSLVSLASYYSLDGLPPLLSVAALLIYVGCYQISFGPISWLMVSEIFPLRVRGRALSLATIVNFGSNWLVALLLPPVQVCTCIGGWIFIALQVDWFLSPFN
eukprot:jgi/Mesvir1/25039/Mv16978-RA.1